jgi:hypothetical protein
MMVRTNKSIASIIYNQEMIRPGSLNMLCHFHGKFYARIGGSRYGPGFGSVMEAVDENLLELKEILLNGHIIFPAQK